MRGLTVQELRERLADLPGPAVLCACSDRAHAACDLVTGVDGFDSGRTVSLTTRHPSNVNDDYPFREPEVAALIVAAQRVLDWLASDKWTQLEKVDGGAELHSALAKINRV